MSAVSTHTKPAITKEIIMPGPALLAATAVSTKMPVPMTAPMPSMVSSNQPSWRFKPFFSAAARIMSSDLVRKFIATPEGFLMARSWDSYVQKAIEDAANRGSSAALALIALVPTRVHEPAQADIHHLDAHRERHREVQVT